MNTTTSPVETDAGAYTETLLRLPESAPPARRLVEFALDSWGLPGLTEDATLIVSELVANAVRHARADWIRVTVSRVGDRRVRLAVVDKSRVLPQLRTPGLEDVRGRGLHLIDELSDRWGTDPLPWGKRVWAELRTDGEQ
ncbi:ATP-binding protein [Streptomyces mirabilis]|uniref:ATP-binding protein n=1 Tax=Streptomyces mirabilis TaxID=68239 RepID=UPI0033A353D1